MQIDGSIEYAIFGCRGGDTQTTILTKNELIKTMESFPERVSVEDVMEKLMLLAKIEKGCQDADEGKTVSHKVAEKRLKKWLT